MEENKTNLKGQMPLILFLAIIILALLGGILLLNKNSNALKINGKSLPKTLSQVQSSPAPEECKEFKDLNAALQDIGKACILNLSNQNLSALPSSMSNFIRLNTIILNNNNFSEFPEILTSIPTLTEVDIANNHLTSVPNSLSNLKKLQVLDLSGNNIPQSEQERIKTLFPTGQPKPPPSIRF